MSSTARTVEIPQGETFVWVENLTNELSNFSHEQTGLRYQFAPSGFAGSIHEVPTRVANDPWMRRAIKRGKLRRIDEQDEAEQRIAQLRIPGDEDYDSDERPVNHAIREALADGASERMGTHFTKPGLQEFGEAKKTSSVEEIWAGGKAEAEARDDKPAQDGVERGQFSGNGVAPSPTDVPDAPLDPAQVLQQPEKYGDA